MVSVLELNCLKRFATIRPQERKLHFRLQYIEEYRYYHHQHRICLEASNNPGIPAIFRIPTVSFGERHHHIQYMCGSSRVPVCLPEVAAKQ